MGNLEELDRASTILGTNGRCFCTRQRQLVEREYNGPARVAGSAGTGKTIVALHRAVALARKHEDARVLLTTFSEPLARSLHSKLQRLLGNEPRLGERVEVHSMAAIARRLYRANFAGAVPKIASPAAIRDALSEAASSVPNHKFTPRFLWAEWQDVVDAWQLETWRAYRDVPRLGRKTRLPESQRAALWRIFSAVRTSLAAAGVITEAGLFSQLAAELRDHARSPYDYAVIDEAQDVSIAQLRFLSALGKNHSELLFFAGDLGQRIFSSHSPGRPSAWIFGPVHDA